MNLRLLSITFVLAVLFSACGKKVDPFSSSLFSVNPSPLELKGSLVSATITGRIPQGWFDKDYVLQITPVLYHQDGETVAKMYQYQGENVHGNGISISKSEGGIIKMQATFDYIPAMKISELYLRFELYKKGKQLKNIPPVKVADGVIATESLATALSTSASIAPDAFQKMIKETHEADIMFLIQEARLRSSETNSQDVKGWQELVVEADRNNRKKVEVEISSYASPDGGYELNKKLSEQRDKNTTEYVREGFFQERINPGVYSKYTAQDWEGFKKLVEASNLQDKNIILRVLEMYRDPETREREIKNIAAIYLDLADTILPRLRRSRLIANVEIIGKTDDEIVNAVKTKNYNSLSVEELLYSATLEGVNGEEVYKQATIIFPNDYRGYNNLGTLAFKKGNISAAENFFKKAQTLAPNAPDVNANFALLALNNGNVSVAEEYIGKSAGATSLDEILGLAYIKKGDYTKAQNAFKDAKTNNAALAQLLNKNYSQAQRTIQAIPEKNGETYYIAAIIDARTNNTAGVVKNLNLAQKNGVHLSEITQDAEFTKYLSNEEVIKQLGK